MKICLLPLEGSVFKDVAPKHLEKIKQTAPLAQVRVGLEADTEVVLTTRFNELSISLLPQLKWIHLTSAGVDKLDRSLIESEVLITNSSGTHSIPISEHVLAFMLMFARAIPATMRNQIIDKKWRREVNYFPISELEGKTVVIVGVGRIGEEIARLTKAFGMKTIGVVRTPRKLANVDEVLSLAELDGLLPECDFVIDCLPATAETVRAFNISRFKKFKKGSYFINIGRGDTVVEEDLISALEEKLVAGAGLDVFEKEPLSDSSPLWSMDNVIITPHISGWTPKYMDRVIDIFCDNLRAYLSHQQLPNLVDKKLGY